MLHQILQELLLCGVGRRYSIKFFLDLALVGHQNFVRCILEVLEFLIGAKVFCLSSLPRLPFWFLALKDFRGLDLHCWTFREAVVTAALF